MKCQERDHIILAFALAANERNIAASDLEIAATDAERQHALRTIENARGYCHQLRDLIVVHCRRHGC